MATALATPSAVMTRLNGTTARSSVCVQAKSCAAIASPPSAPARSKRSDRASASLSQAGDAGASDEERHAAAGDRGEVAEVARARDLAFLARLLDLARRGGKRLVLGGVGHVERRIVFKTSGGELERDKALETAPNLGRRSQATNGRVHPLAELRTRSLHPRRHSEARLPHTRTTMKHAKSPPSPSAAIVSAVAIPAMAQVMVGGAPMYSNKDIVDNAVNSKDHTTLVAAVKAAGLVDTLKGAGPFTVFAPTNAAFAALPAGTVDTCSSRRASRPSPRC